MPTHSSLSAPVRNALFAALLMVPLFTGCGVASSDTRAPSAVEVSIPAPVTERTCTGQPGIPSLSTSYLPGAPEIREAGSRIEIVLSILVPVAGKCTPAANALVEIWHTSPDGVYMPERWRTALRADENGVVTYSTIMPGSEGESQPHVHVRATLGDRVVEWVIGGPALETAGRVERTLAMEVVEQTGSTTTTISGLSGV